MCTRRGVRFGVKLGVHKAVRFARPKPRPKILIRRAEKGNQKIVKIRKNGLGVKKGTQIEIAGFLVLYFRNFRVVYCFFRNFLEHAIWTVWNDPKNPFSAGFGPKFDSLGLPKGRFFPKFKTPFSRVPFDQPPRAEKRTPKSPKSTISLKSEKGVF